MEALERQPSIPRRNHQNILQSHEGNKRYDQILSEIVFSLEDEEKVVVLLRMVLGIYTEQKVKKFSGGKLPRFLCNGEILICRGSNHNSQLGGCLQSNIR